MDNKSFADALDAVYGKTDQSESELNQSFFEALESVYPSIDAAPAVAPKIVEGEPAYPPQLTPPGIVPPKNRIIPTGTTLPFPLPELPGPKPRPKPALPESIPFNLEAGTVEIPTLPEKSDQHIFSGWGDIIPSFKGGSLRLWGNMKNLMADYEEAHRKNPKMMTESRFPAITGPGAGLAAVLSSMIEAPELSAEQKELSEIREQALLKQGAELLKQSSDLGRPLSFEETTLRAGFGDYLVGLVGQAGPTMLAGMVSLGLASPLLLEAELNAELREIPKLSSERQMRLAQAGGLIAGALEMAGLGFMTFGVPKTLLAKMGMKALTQRIEKISGKSAAHRFATKMTGRATVGALGEMGTEFFQEETLMTFSDKARKEAGAEPLSPEEKAYRRKEAAAAGFFSGGPARVAIGGVQDTAGMIKEGAKPYLPEDALENPFAKSLERQLFDALAGITPNFQKIELPDITPVPPSSELESTPPTEVSPTEVQGPPPGPPALPPIKVHKDVKSLATFLTNNMDDLESYLEGEETTFEGWIKKHAEGSPEEVRKFADSFTPEVMDKFDEEGGTLEEWINKQAEEFTKPPDIKTPEWQDYKNAKGKILAQFKKIGDGRIGETRGEAHPVVVRKNKDGIFRVAEFWGTELSNISPSQLFTNAYGGFDNVPSGLLNKFATEAEATEAAKSFIGEPVVTEPEPLVDEKTDIGEDETIINWIKRNTMENGQLTRGMDYFRKISEGRTDEELIKTHEWARKRPKDKKTVGLTFISRFVGEALHPIISGRGYKTTYDDKGKAHFYKPAETEPVIEPAVLPEPEPLEEPKVETKPEPVEEKPKEERVFKPLVNEKGKPESQVVIKALKGVRLIPVKNEDDLPIVRLNPRKANELKIINKLVDRGYIDKEGVGSESYRLTPEGKDAALQIRENEELAEEGLPMENYTPKKGRKTPTQPGGDVKFSKAEFEGGPSWSQGHILVKGEPPRNIPKTESENSKNFTPIIEAAPKLTKANPSVDPIGFTIGDDFTRVHFAPVGVYEEGMQTTVINAEYYDLFKKSWPDAKFVMDEKAGSMKPISVYSGDEFVGIIMPMRNEGGPEPGFQKILKGKPAEVKPKAKPKAKPPVVEAPTVKMVEPEPVSSYPQSREDLEKLFGEKVSPAKLDAMLEPDVWKGLVHGKPTRLKVFRGEGKRAVYAEGVEGAALGEGRYSALKEDDAKVFGDVKPLTVELKQPAVLTSDEDLVKWFGEAIPSENADRVPLLKKARAEMVKHGYDGVIINIPKMADANEKGKTAKRLREIFNVSQVVEFKSKPSATESLGDEAILSTASEEIDQKRQVPPSIRELIYVDMASAANMDESLSMDERVGILRNYTPRKLEEVFSKMMYDKFGIRIEKATSTIDITLDNMMDAYVNFEGMAAVLGAPLKIMGLNETLSYQTVPIMKTRYGETFALYAPGQVLIKVGERNRSFAHEWMHALDFHILETMGQGKGKGMSGRLRGKEQKDPDDHTWYKNTLEPWMEENTTERIKLAFADLLNVVFFSDAEVAAKIMALELKIAKARSEDVIAGYNKDIRDLENGMSSKRLRKTYYYWGAKEQDLKEGRDPDGPGYYIMPTEMLARAFEAYMANKIELQAQTAEYPGTELITMPDWAYRDKKFTPGPIVELQNPQINERWEKIYPKNGDRHAIFRAFDYLFEALVEDVYEGEAAIAKPSRTVEHPLLGTRVEDVRPWTKEAKINAARRIKGARNQQLQEDKRMELAERWKNKTKSERAWIKFEDGMAFPVLFSKRAQLFAQIRKYRDEVDAEGNPVPVSDALTEIMRRIIDDPGGRTLFLKGKDDFIGTWTEASRSGIRRELTAFKIVIDKRDALNFTEDEQKQLRLLMVSDPATIKKAELAQLNKNVVKLAGELRIFLNRIFKYGKSAAGISFLEPNAYLPRMIDRVMLDMEEGTFRSQSTKMFEEVLWIQEVGELNDGDLEQFKLIGEIAAHPRMQFQRDGSAETFTEPNRDIQTIARLTKDIKRLERKIEKAQEDGDGEKFEYFQNELNKIIADLPVLHAGLHERAYKEVGHGWSVEHTNEWVRNLHLPKGDSGNFGLEPSPFISNFTKQRKFGREADTYMANFYQPAIESISSYIQAVIKKTEFNKRFSPDYIKAHRKKDRYATKTRHGKKGEHSRDYLEWLMDEKLAMYMSAEDFEAARTDIMTILGRNPPPKSTYYKHLNWFHSVGLTFMLTEAAATSFPEPFVTGVVTGRGFDGLKSFALTLQELLQYVSKDVRQTVQARHQLANILGVVDASGMTDIAVNRLGGLMVDDPKTNKWVSQFFKISGLQGLTMAQRRSVMAIGFQFFKEKANQFMNPVGDNAAAISKNKKEARDILLEYGIAKGKEEEFAFWFLPVMEGKKLPDASDIMNLYGEMNEMQKYLAVAINRLVNRSIQDPEPASKPRHAEGPWGRMIYSIMGFSYSVHANVIKPVYRDLKAVGPTESLASIVRTGKGGIDQQMNIMGKGRGERLKIYGKGTLKQAQVWSKIAPSLVGLYVTHAMVTVMREMLTNKERWDRWKREGVLWERIFELAFYRTGTTGPLDPLLQAIRASRYDVDLTRMVIGATPSFWVQNTNAMARALISERNSPNTTAYEKKGLEGFYRSVIGPLILAAATNPRTFSALGPYASLTAGAFAVTAASDTAQQGFSSVILDTVFPKGKGAEAFRRARGIRKGRKGRKSR